MVSGLIEDFLRIFQKLHKITENSIENRDSILILTNLVVVHKGKFTQNLKQIRALV